MSIFSRKQQIEFVPISFDQFIQVIDRIAGMSKDQRPSITIYGDLHIHQAGSMTVYQSLPAGQGLGLQPAPYLETISPEPARVCQVCGGARQIVSSVDGRHVPCPYCRGQ